MLSCCPSQSPGEMSIFLIARHRIAEIVCIAEEAPGTAHSCPRLMEQELLINCLEEAGGVS